MQNFTDIKKGKVLIIVEIVNYVTNTVVTKTILKKTTGSIGVISFDLGEALPERISPFDTFVQIIDGQAEIVIDGNACIMKTGDAIIIPAHSRNSFKAINRFKMISTVIKSGYE